MPEERRDNTLLLKRFTEIFAAFITLTATGCSFSPDINTASSEAAVTSAITEAQSTKATTKANEKYVNPYSGMTAAEITATLTTEEKAYQMVIPAIYRTDRSDMQDYCYGSILSQFAPTAYTALEWGNIIDGYQKNALKADSPIPFIYGQDSVHGVNYCLNTVIFPHNINIGAADDPELTYQMGLAVADEIKLSNMLWNYSPCVAVAEDPRWGRTYESYSSDPELVRELSSAYTQGLIDGGVVACAKHFIGDGSVTFGTGEQSEGYTRIIDRGNAELSDSEIAEQLAIYEDLIKMGVQSVMVSHSALNGVKMHENAHYLTDILRGELGFEGVIVSDWNSIQNITSSSNYKQQIITAVNAGIDWLMEPDTFDKCAKYLIEAVEEGSISQERMDDAVTRIIQLKLNAGLFDDPYLDNIVTIQEGTGSQEYRELAEKLVEKSQVLIKNENNLLPLKKGTTIFVTGPAADDSGVQCGGWTREWNGLTDAEWNGEFIPGTTTILEGLKEIAADYDITVITDEKEAESADITLLCIGEQPYAEWHGDTADLSITDSHGLEKNKEFIELAESLDKPTITLIVAGRNVIIDEYEENWDSIVMCGLPGTEGSGVANILVGKTGFTGKLSMPWYSDVDDIEKNRVWLEQGFGLTTGGENQNLHEQSEKTRKEF